MFNFFKWRENNYRHSMKVIRKNVLRSHEAKILPSKIAEMGREYALTQK